MKSKLQIFRQIFLVVFILASLSVFGIGISLYNLVQSYYQEILSLTGEDPNLVSSTELEIAVPIAVSISTALTALLGFIITTALNIKKEKREVVVFELALKQKEIELERARLELEELKKQSKKKKK